MVARISSPCAAAEKPLNGRTAGVAPAIARAATGRRRIEQPVFYRLAEVGDSSTRRCDSADFHWLGAAYFSKSPAQGASRHFGLNSGSCDAMACPSIGAMRRSSGISAIASAILSRPSPPVRHGSYRRGPASFSAAKTQRVIGRPVRFQRQHPQPLADLRPGRRRITCGWQRR